MPAQECRNTRIVVSSNWSTFVGRMKMREKALPEIIYERLSLPRRVGMFRFRNRRRNNFSRITYFRMLLSLSRVYLLIIDSIRCFARCCLNVIRHFDLGCPYLFLNFFTSFKHSLNPFEWAGGNTVYLLKIPTVIIL